ncbi:MAG: twin-arginine translocase TatA/TatE family subunit [Magnetococcales bacterium]|nr:twin-arginine translocase TatA/TatE family subunit [Magnetococcales bacterium]
MFGLGATELIIILVIVLILFGAGKLPKVMKDVGRGVKSFKSAMNETEEQLKNSTESSEPSAIEGEVKKDDNKAAS